MKQRVGVVRLAVLFEGGLGVLAVGLAWWLDISLAPRLRPSWAATLRGVAATLPMLGGLAWAVRSEWPPIADLRHKVAPLVAELFRGAGWIHLAAVAIAAGVGEEMLFRGALQPVAVRWCGEATGVLAVSLLFGVLHALTPTYFVLATAVGLYFGWLTQAFGDLTAPMIAHATYDFVALLVLLGVASRGTVGVRPLDEDVSPMPRSISDTDH